MQNNYFFFRQKKKKKRGFASVDNAFASSGR